jgi:hypothetical protein
VHLTHKHGDAQALAGCCLTGKELPAPNFTVILQHFYRTSMTRSTAPVYTLRGRTGTEAAPATEQGFPGAGAEDGFATAAEK